MQIEELKKIKALKTKEDADHLIKAAIQLSDAGKVIETGFGYASYKIEFIASDKHTKLKKDGAFVLARTILDISVEAARYISVVTDYFEAIQIICHVGKDIHYVSTPYNFLIKLGKAKYKEEDAYVFLFGALEKWLRIATYRFRKGEK